MLKSEVLAALNKQIQHELSNYYAYRAMSVWFEQEVLKGFAAHYKTQGDEETGHAERFITHVQDMGGDVVLGAIGAPKMKFASPLDAAKAAQKLERVTTGMINDLYAVAVKANDLATQHALQWFINEQIEEEKTADEIVKLLEKAADSVGAIYQIDHHMGKK